MTTAVAVRQGDTGPARLAAVPDAGSTIVPTPGERLREAGERVLVTLVDRLAAMALEKVEDLTAGLDDIAKNGGVGIGAALGAAKAKLGGRNIVWGAIKGAFAALGTFAKVLVGVIVALAPVFLVIALVVLVLAVLVWAIVAAVKAMSS